MERDGEGEREKLYLSPFGIADSGVRTGSLPLTDGVGVDTVEEGEDRDEDIISYREVASIVSMCNASSADCKRYNSTYISVDTEQVDDENQEYLPCTFI